MIAIAFLFCSYITQLNKYQKKMSIIVGKKNSSIDQATEDVEYTVEQVLAVRKRRGHHEYLIKWKGYESIDNTWEPRSQFTSRQPIDNFYAVMRNSQTTRTFQFYNEKYDKWFTCDRNDAILELFDEWCKFGKILSSKHCHYDGQYNRIIDFDAKNVFSDAKNPIFSQHNIESGRDRMVRLIVR
jgi:hypothetical protein